MRNLLVCVALAGLSVQAQDPCGGNGGMGSLTQSVQALGALHTTTISGLPGAPFVLAVSGSLAPQVLPGVGLVCIDLASPGFWIVDSGNLPATGELSFTYPIPSTPEWGSAVFFAQGAVGDPGHPSGIAITGALRKDFEPADSFTPVGPMPAVALAPAAAHLTGRDWVLVTGGHGGAFAGGGVRATTSVYFPLARLFLPGPAMGTPRVFHTATALADGRVLLAGGVSTLPGGPAQSSCEIFDPVSYAMLPAAPMGMPRTWHRAILLDDGRVLVTGGATVAGQESDILALGQAFGNAEIYDPVANTWTPAGNSLPGPRISHAMAKLQDGRVLISGGWNGTVSSQFGVALTPTDQCSLFDPATNLFSAAPPLPEGRARHGASVLQNGDVLICGGNFASPNLLPTNPPSNTTLRFAGTGWSAGPALPEPMEGVVTQFSLPGGAVWVAPYSINGAVGSSPATRPAVLNPATGVFMLAAQPQSPEGGFAAALLAEGSILVCGGNPYTPAAQIYTPIP